MNTYVKFGTLMILVVGSLVWLAVGGVRDSKAYYRTIPELTKMADGNRHQRLRVSGHVKAGSIQRGAAGTAFTLYEEGQTLRVLYAGSDPLPDTFKDDSQALADGRLGPDGIFQASKIQAKCASKYEAKPGSRGVSHQAPANATRIG